MKNLPQEILDIICEYADVKCRNGCYMNQIAATDPRRNLLRKIPRIKEVKNNTNLQKYYFVDLQKLSKIVYYPEEYNRNIFGVYYNTPKYGESYYTFYCESSPKFTIYKIDLSGIYIKGNNNGNDNYTLYNTL